MLFELFLCVSVSASSLPKLKERLSGNNLVEFLNSQQDYFEAELSLFSREEISERIMKPKFLMDKNEAASVTIDVDLTMNATEIPTSFDSRTNWPSCASIGAIYDQGRCGSCWAFCTAETMSDRTCIAKQKHVVLSPQDLIGCCPDCGLGCDGGYYFKALQFWNKEGVCTGGPTGSHDNCKPYTSGNGTTGTCEKQCQEEYNISYSKDKHRGSTSFVLPQNVEAIQKEIMTNGPVSSIYEVYEDFMHYKSGIYVHTGGELLGAHCVKTIGWGEENGIPYWLVANSWNTNWGEKGFFRIIRGRNEVQFESAMAAGMP